MGSSTMLGDVVGSLAVGNVGGDGVGSEVEGGTDGDMIGSDLVGGTGGDMMRSGVVGDTDDDTVERRHGCGNNTRGETKVFILDVFPVGACGKRRK